MPPSVALIELKQLKYELKLRFNSASEAHITSALAGTSLALPIAAGKLLLGTWQSILLLELDGPRRRKLACTVFESQDNFEAE